MICYYYDVSMLYTQVTILSDLISKKVYSGEAARTAGPYASQRNAVAQQ